MATASRSRSSARPVRSVPRYPIRIAAERSGVAATTLRAWERRYGAVAPPRSDGAQRLYSDDDIARLRLIAALSATGYAIRELARQSTKSLEAIAAGAHQRAAAGGSRTPGRIDTDRPADAVRQDAIDALLAATERLDAPSFRSTLANTVLSLGPVAALDSVVSPFLLQLGEAWACDSLGVAQEHFASAIVRDALGSILQTATPEVGAPTLVASTVAGELHELGTMMACVAAAVVGWHVLYLGPNLPSAELARIAKKTRARVICLGIAERGGAARHRAELVALRRAVGARTTIIAGGDATQELRLTLRRERIDVVASRAAFLSSLEQLWNRTA